MKRRALGWLTMLAAAGVVACGGKKEQPAANADTTARDLSMAPAESVATLKDQPVAQPAPKPRAKQPAPAQKETPPPPPVHEAPLSLATGTTIALVARDSLNSRHNKKGDAVIARNRSAIVDGRGRTVIPAHATFRGTISDIAPAEHPGGEGRMVVTFHRVRFGGHGYAIQARVDSLGTYMKGRGVTAGDAAKVGAGAVVGAIAGRLIGGNKTGTAVGAAAGAAAGVGVAAATRDIDIILPAGAPIRLVLTAPFVVKPINQ